MTYKKDMSPPMIFEDNFIERTDIAWRIEQAEQEPNNPLLEPKYPWDSAMFGSGHGTVLKDPIDGLFKTWLPSIEDKPPAGYTKFRLTYAYSKDGVNWVRPELDICPFPGYPKTNILFDFDSGGGTTMACVFIEPNEHPDEPYEMFCFRHPYEYCPNLCVAGFNQTPAKDRGDAVRRYYGLYRYRSRDGLHWRGIEGPIQLKSGDGIYIYKDKDGQGYVAHHKTGGIRIPAPIGGYIPYDIGVGQGIRIAQRRTSRDGTNWSETIPILVPDYQDSPGDQIMDLTYYPYGNGIIGTVGLYHAMTQRMDLQFAASTDGINWWRPIPRQACLPLASLGDYGGGIIWQTRTLIEDGDRLYLYYGAVEGLHGDIYSNKPNNYGDYRGAFCRASWEKGRMWAAVPAPGGNTVATLVSLPVKPADKTLYINGVTIKDGEIRAELLHSSGDRWQVPTEIVNGWARDDCIPLKGDHKCVALQWKDKDTRLLKGEVCVKFYLRRARLYGFEWR